MLSSPLEIMNPKVMSSLLKITHLNIGFLHDLVSLENEPYKNRALFQKRLQMLGCLQIATLHIRVKYTALNSLDAWSEISVVYLTWIWSVATCRLPKIWSLFWKRALFLKGFFELTWCIEWDKRCVGTTFSSTPFLSYTHKHSLISIQPRARTRSPS